MPLFLLSLQILLDPLHRLNHILAMAEGLQAEESFATGAETGAGGADCFAFETLIVEERRIHVCDRRNSIRKHLKSQWSTAVNLNTFL